jgi:hypothetical protein
MPKTGTLTTTLGAKRRRRTKKSARREGRVKAEAAPRAVARSDSLEAALAPCNPLDSEHSRLL